MLRAQKKGRQHFGNDNENCVVIVSRIIHVIEGLRLNVTNKFKALRQLSSRLDTVMVCGTPFTYRVSCTHPVHTGCPVHNLYIQGVLYIACTYRVSHHQECQGCQLKEFKYPNLVLKTPIVL